MIPADEPIHNGSDFANKFLSLWHKTETFGVLYGNNPNDHRDSEIDHKVKEYVMSASDRSAASALLGHESTRFFLVAKAINYFLTMVVLRVSVIRGFDSTADSEIGQIKGIMYPGK